MTPEDVLRDPGAGLRDWVRRHGEVPETGLHDRTPLVEAGVLSSMVLVELLLWIEEATGRPVNVTALRPGSFRDVATIRDTFFGGEA